MRLPFILWSIAGVPSSQALPGFLITVPPPVLASAVLGALAVWIQTQRIKKVHVIQWRANCRQNTKKKSLVVFCFTLLREAAFSNDQIVHGLLPPPFSHPDFLECWRDETALSLGA